MQNTEKQVKATKELVLEAACEVFARDGYHEGTVAKICEMAGANRAAVNYHFGDKESLYREVWKHALTVALEAYPLTPRESGLAAEESLRLYMRSLLLRAFDPGPPGCFTRLMAFEITEPQPFLAEERRSAREIHDSYFELLMRELLGERATEHDLTLCRFMIMAPSMGVGIRRFARHSRNTPHAMFEFEPEQMAGQMFEFALAGISDLRRHIDAREAGAGEGVE